ncbi:PREDICTED: phospholipase D Z-like isoform X2 [Tarenaya hassleriana]|uniref:phospholipase D Z-like isoform X2 n=1 Tax=Tarenaya hassleriana TaxID=28532 RepID=UPI00053C4CED|nr:PREDICTED: phospholipase D Z-like isoform X2 [Tarenaya hassleriana]
MGSSSLCVLESMAVGQNRIRVLYGVVLFVATLSLPRVTESSARCKAWLVQSIPTDTPELRRVSGVLSTGEVFQWLANNSTQSLDIIAQYWQLQANPKDPRSGDFGYSDSDLKRFGAHEGSLVYDSIDKAANRNVSIRLLSHSGVYPDYTKEPSDLASGRSNVKNVTLLLSKWWGSGIVHAKVWISDRRDVYIGSANNDWKSLTQVKEVGVYFNGCPDIAKRVELYFDNLWRLAFLDSSVFTRTVSDQQWLINRIVPCWSRFLPTETRCRSPLPRYIKTPHVVGYPSLSDPEMFDIDIDAHGRKNCFSEPQPSYLSFAPPELLFGKHQSDEQGWIDTIASAGEGGTVRISTMDLLGQSQYTKPTVFWSSLSSAISKVVFSKNAKVKILVAYWAHFIETTDLYLRSLLYSNVLCSSSDHNNCSGQVEIKYYVVPGYNQTGPAIRNGTRTENIYPDFTRVNHGKYAVSDVRAHIGTSNLVWDYFYGTSGVSFGTYNTEIVQKLQEIFDADWESPNAVPVLQFKAFKKYIK